MTYASATDYLFGLKGKGSKYGIDRMRLFAAALGQPQLALPVIHIAGTNGKGSVAAMCEAVFRQSGRRTGLYTSPHLVRLGERVQVDRQILTESEIVRYTEELKEVAERISAGAPEDHPTFFEFMTAMAFLHFVRKKVDIAIIEVGLGGRLDATNIVDPDVSVITSIALDHTQQLGSTIEAIAREKAGIIKLGKPVVLGLMDPAARAAIERIAKEQNAPVFAVEDRFGTDVSAFPETNLSGDHQRANAAAATLVFEVIRNKHPVPPEAIPAGLQHVSWPGRWDKRTIGDKTVIFEAAHNPQGARTLDCQLARLIAETGQRPIVAAGALGDARAQALLETIARHAREIHLFTPDQPRATPVATLRDCIPADFSGEVREGKVSEAFSPGQCHLGEPGDTIVVTGSIYLIGEIMEQLEAAPVQESRLQD